MSKFLANHFVSDGVWSTRLPGPSTANPGTRTCGACAERGIGFEQAWQQVEQEEAAKIPWPAWAGDDVAAWWCFASEQRALITGSCFHVNGGKFSAIA